MSKNPNCDNNHCQNKTGEVRLLPTGGGGNSIVCVDCFKFEMKYRRDRNSELGTEAFKIEDWEDLKVYEI